MFRIFMNEIYDTFKLQISHQVIHKMHNHPKEEYKIKDKEYKEVSRMFN